MDTANQRALARLLALQSARRGDFVLSSGRRSNLYVDARLTTMSPEGLALIGPLALAVVRNEFSDVHAVGGLTLGADPIACAIAYASAATAAPIRAFTVRKEAKSHGTGRQIEGPFRRGDRVVVVEDTVTSGASALRASDVVRREGGVVIGVVALVDREEGGREAIEAAGFRLVSLTRAAELVEILGP